MSQPRPDAATASVEELTVWAHRAAVEHLEACEEAHFAEENGPEDDQDEADLVESPAVGPFCGCTDCVVREVLHAAWPMLLAAARALDAEGEQPPGPQVPDRGPHAG